MPRRIPQQLAKKRRHNFSEVALGFSKRQAEGEGRRCLGCKNPPCVKGCPVEIDIPAFIKLIKENKTKEALAKIKEKNNLPAICGRVCPQEDQCQASCVLNKKNIAINIGALERYAADNGLTFKPPAASQQAKKNGIKIAVVGSGPAGLTCAADLAKIGYQVVIFESLHRAGGVLIYGIPEFRLPKKIVELEVEYVKGLGVRIETDTLIGNTYSMRDLFSNGFRAIFIGAGAGLPQFLNIPGENLGRVYSANEFLTRINLMRADKFPEYATPINAGNKVAVVGGGNVAVDCARVALRLGREVTLVYRRTEKEMPARREEIQNAKEEGVIFKILTQPVKIIGDEKGFVAGMECLQMRLGEPDGSGRRRPIAVLDSNFILDVDTVIIAIGENPNPLLAKTTPGLKVKKDKTVVADENFMTSLPRVFAGGDIISGAATVISAMGAGKKAALAIDRYMKGVHNAHLSLRGSR